MATKSRKKTDLYKEKKWYPIFAPEEYNRMVIGETLANESEKLEGRIISTTLAELISDWQKQNVKMIFKVDEVGDSGAYTKFIGHELTRDYLRSLVKRRTSKIGGNVIVTTKDGIRLRIKPVGYTVKRTQTSSQKVIRSIMEEIVVKCSAKLSYTELINEIVLGKLSSEIYKEVRSMHPVRRVEIEKSHVLGKARRTTGSGRKNADKAATAGAL